jgi:hypothetical protein
VMTGHEGVGDATQLKPYMDTWHERLGDRDLHDTNGCLYRVTEAKCW